MVKVKPKMSRDRPGLRTRRTLSKAKRYSPEARSKLKPKNTNASASTSSKSSTKKSASVSRSRPRKRPRLSSAKSEERNDSKPEGLEDVSDSDVEFYEKALVMAKNDLGENSENAFSILTSPKTAKANVGVRSPEVIQIGKYEVTTWYSSFYPEEYSKLYKLYVCEFCLQYMKTKFVWERHRNKCTMFHPPGMEMFRQSRQIDNEIEELSVFEVDASKHKSYCVNLCRLSKLFLDHKTLYYDVEPFNFYVLTYNNKFGNHLIGYFSKQKGDLGPNNLSCIMNLPQFQRRGYGEFLIDISYLLSRKEGKLGSPERPFSDLGELAYQKYWRCRMLDFCHEFLQNRSKTSLTINEICKHTGMVPEDVVTTLRNLNFLQQVLAVHVKSETPDKKKKKKKRKKKYEWVFAVDWKVVNEYLAKQSINKSRIFIQEEHLRWVPLLSDAQLKEELDKDELEDNESETASNAVSITNGVHEDAEESGDDDNEDEEVKSDVKMKVEYENEDEDDEEDVDMDEGDDENDVEMGSEYEAEGDEDEAESESNADSDSNYEISGHSDSESYSDEEDSD